MATRHAESLRAVAREARYSPLGQRAGATRQRRLVIPSSLGLPTLPIDTSIRRKAPTLHRPGSTLAEAMEAVAETEAADAKTVVSESESEAQDTLGIARTSSRVCELAPSFSTLTTSSPAAMRSRVAAGITMEYASPTKSFGYDDDDGSFKTGCKFRAAIHPSPSLGRSVLPEVKCGSPVSTRAGQAASARERRERCKARYETRYEAPYEACDAASLVSDAEAHAEGLLPRPKQLDNLFQGLSNNTLSGV